MEHFDPEYEIEKRFKKGFQAVFEKDDEFKYNKNDECSNIRITLDYPEDERIPEQFPHIVITNVSYEDDLQMSFGYNYMRDYKKGDINNYARDFAHIFPYNLQILCVGNKNESKDLASKVHWYLSFAAQVYFSEELSLQISRISKGPTSPSKQFPEKIYNTPISVTGTLYWVGTKKHEDILSWLDKPLKNVKINFK